MDQSKIEAIIKNSSDEKLLSYIPNYHKYKPEHLQTVVEELDRREVAIADNDRAVVEHHIAKGGKQEPGSFTFDKQSHLYTDDGTAPLFYSKLAIRSFSLFFATIFGSVLLYNNLKKNNLKGANTVLIFGIVYTIAAVIALNLLPARSTAATLFVNSIGGFILTNYFWPRYIGNDTQFRKKPVWKALIVSILIVLPFIILIIISI